MTGERDHAVASAWRALEDHARALQGSRIVDLFAADGGRFERFSLDLDDLLLDVSKHLATEETWTLLRALARAADVEGLRRAMFAGERINTSENRAVLHVALRAPDDAVIKVDGQDVMPEVRRVRDQIGAFAEAVRAGAWRGFRGDEITDIVNIGIGGSDLGPRMAVEALAPYHHPRLRAHFVANVDGAEMGRTLAKLDPARTLFIVASKTFTTDETMLNAATARAWLVDRLGTADAVARHFVAISTETARVRAFGIDAANMFAFWDWVGGRYSMWSAIGLPIALMIGEKGFRALLAGAHAMDRHFQQAPIDANLPATLALIGLWDLDVLGAENHVVLPYDQGLVHLPSYLQQADMESNGKSVDRDGRPVARMTAPILWGSPGTMGQHAFHQLLHQGTRRFSADFILPAKSAYPIGRHHATLAANCFAQTEALMVGRDEAAVVAELKAQGLDDAAIAALLPHKLCPGNRGTTTILFRRLDPFALGRLVALYEHKIFVQGAIWNVNSYDQWGVELGKQLAGRILPELTGGAVVPHDASTTGLISRFRRLATEP
jgi:glucose-6-phosphate isomerase